MQDTPPAHSRPAAPLEILVAGSAGKASTAAMIAALLAACGETVAHHNASYIHSPRERLTINGQPVSEAAIPPSPVPPRSEEETRLSPPLRSGEGRGEGSRPEPPPHDTLLDRALAAAGVRWLVSSGVPARGARVELIAFTPIFPNAGSAADAARDLCNALPRAPRAVTAPQRESALDVLRPAFPDLQEVARVCRLSRGRFDLDRQEFRLQTPRGDYRLTLPVQGQFQLENAATAILAVEQLAPLGVALTPAAARGALAELRLPARLEILKRRPLTVVDACSQIASLRRACAGLRELASGRHTFLVLDLGAGLDPAPAIEAAATVPADLFAVLPSSATEAHRQVMTACYEAGLPVQVAPDVAAAVDAALATAGPGDTVAVAGSRAAAATARALVLGLMPDAPL